MGGLRRRAGAVALAAVIAASITGTGARAGTMENYIVLYKGSDVPSDSEFWITTAGGSVVHSYDEIGVVVARSDSATFRQTLVLDQRVEGVAPTSGFGAQMADPSNSSEAEGPPPGDLPNAPASSSDPLAPLQWDMRQIHAPQAHTVTAGSRAVSVGVIDTGVHANHPDLRQNMDMARSVSCESGAPVTDPSGAAWDDRIGHGTHVAGTVAAAANGLGIVGTAPNVTLVGIKASTDEGFFFPEMVVCAFMWAGAQQLDVTNNSYFADPYLYNCRNDEVQRAIWKAEQRAIRYALTQGVTVVSAAGNSNDDLAHPTIDEISPDFPPGSEVTREVNNACVVIPVEIPGVLGVSANGNAPQPEAATRGGQNDDAREPKQPNERARRPENNGRRPNAEPAEQPADEPNNETQPNYAKSFYSNYGVGVIEVVAPGGDSVYGRTPEAPNGRVLSTYPPGNLLGLPQNRIVEDCNHADGASPCSYYAYLQGTSMASPHVAGIAALIISRFGDSSTPQNGKMRPGQVQALLEQTAIPQPCPPNPFRADTEDEAHCQGGEGNNSFYGHGQADAWRAVMHDTSNGRP